MKTTNQFACRPVTRAFAGSVQAATILVASLGMVTTSNAQVTYVDATLLNTDNAAGGADSTWADGDDGSTGGTVADGTVTTRDDKWRYRAGFGVDGIWEATSSSAGAEDAPLIVTSVSVANGTYNVYAFFTAVTLGAAPTPIASGVDRDFPIRAGNTSATLELFDQHGPASNSTYTGYQVGTAGKNALSGPDALTFTSTPTPQGTRPLLYGMLSTQQVVTDGTLRVYIDDFPTLETSENSNARTWYDGIGYEAVSEPTEFLLTITPATAPATGFDLAWDSQAGKLYNLRTSTDLTSSISTWSLVEGGIEATPPTNTYSVDPAGPRRFYAVEEFDAPPLFATDFEAGDAGFTVTTTEGTAWELGTPDSDNGLNPPNSLVLTVGNSGTNAWGINLGTGDAGFYTNPTTTSLRSPIIDLSAATSAELTFAEAVDFSATDSAELYVISANDDSVVAGPIHTSSTGAMLTAGWAVANGGTPIALPPAAIGQAVRLEWRFTGSADDFLGWYIDDVTVTTE